MNFCLFVARRLFRNSGDRKNVSRPAILIALWGVAVGLAVMIVSICVVMGFKHEIRSKVTGIGSHIQVMNYDVLSSNAPRPIEVSPALVEEIRGVEGVRHVQRFCNKEGILKTDDAFKGILLHGVGPEFDPDFLKENLVEGEVPLFSDTASTNKIVISQKMADELHLQTGDRVFAYFFEQSVRTRRFTVAGIYRTNMSDFDNALVFTDLYTCHRLNDWEQDRYGGVEITVEDFSQTDLVAGRLVKLINRRTDAYGDTYVTMTIQELYPQIFAWLDLLDINVWVILALMVAVAGFTMISGLLIIILERTNFIGIMKALGASNRHIRRIFLYFSVFVIGKGLLWGNVIGLGLVGLQVCFGVFRLDAATYYIEVVPVEFNLWYVLAVNAATLVICTAVLVLPSCLVSNIHPVKAIRFE